jgi:hypothetical protein
MVEMPSVTLRNGTTRLRLAVAACMAAAFTGFAAPAVAQYGPVDPFESATGVLRQGILAANDGQQHAAMVALRELHDPQSRALFERLLKSDDWSLRVDSVLGLAEIAPARKADPALIEALPRAMDRELAVEAVLALELADQDRVRQMLAWSDLGVDRRILLFCELRRLGAEPDRAELLRLLDSKTPEVAGLALAILLDLSAPEAAAAEERVRAAIAELPPKLRALAVAKIAESCAINTMKRAAPFVATLLALPDITGDARARALGSLLVLDAPTGYPILAQAVDADRSQLSLMRHAAILIASGARAPASEWNRLRNGDSLLETIADAGIELSESKDAEAARRLVGLKHRITLRAILEGSRRLGSSFDRILGLECLALLEENPRGLGPLLEPVMRGLSRLAVVAPEELKSALERADGKPDLEEPLLLVLAAAGSPEAAAVALPQWSRTSRLGEALIAVLVARTEPKIGAAELEVLARIAGGAVQVDPAVRLQASWLWLRHAGKLEPAIEALSRSLDGRTQTGQDSSQEGTAPAR